MRPKQVSEPSVAVAADPSVSATIFQGIACTQLDEHEWWLIADMQTRCTDDGYSPMRYQCLLFSLLVPIGLPVMVFLSMHTHRQQLQTARPRQLLYIFSGT